MKNRGTLERERMHKRRGVESHINVLDCEVDLRVIKDAFSLLILIGVVILMLMSFKNDPLTGNHSNSERTDAPGINTQNINSGSPQHYDITGGVCYKYRWGDYDVGSSNVFFGGAICSYLYGGEWTIGSHTPCSFVCSFNETGNNQPYTISEVVGNKTYSNVQMFIVAGHVTLTTSIIFPVQTSHLQVISNVNAEPGLGGSGVICVNGKIDYDQIANGILSWALTFIGFL